MAAIIASLIISRRKAKQRKELEEKRRLLMDLPSNKSATEIPPFSERFNPQDHNAYLRRKYLNKLKKKQETEDNQEKDIGMFQRSTTSALKAAYQDWPFFVTCVIVATTILWLFILGYLGYIYFSPNYIGNQEKIS